MKILIVPGNIQNAKSYPHWGRFVELAKHHEIRKIEGMLPEREIIDLVNWCDTFVSIDSFLPHLAHYHGLTSGIEIWGKSDPEIFGYKKNINLLKDRKYLKPEQFKWWRDEPHDPEVFVLPEEILKAIEQGG